MKLIPMVGFTLAFQGIVLAESQPASPAPTETLDKVSYSIGADLGANFKRSEIAINPDFLYQGVRDALAGKTVMTEDEMKSTIKAWKDDMQAKLDAKHAGQDAEIKAQAPKNKEASEKFLAENKKIDGVVTTYSGLQYKVMIPGDGPKPKPIDTVVVNYRGTLIDGTEFDSTTTSGSATFVVNSVIRGWTEALQLMPLHSKWQVVVPSSQAYGEQGRPPVIGPNQALIFELELLDIKPADPTQAAK